jgi:hypothetical protein
LVSGFGWSEFVVVSMSENEYWKEPVTEWDDDFSDMVAENFADRLMGTCLDIVKRSKTEFVGTKCLANAAKYLKSLVLRETTMVQVRKNIDNEFFETLVKLVKLT